MKGYLDDIEAAASAFFDGWFRTGDIGVFDNDHYLRLTGRIKT
jgi:long-subunit acyl-CoA synthetase (AMP-forming)